MDGGSEETVGFGGEEHTGGRSWEAVEVILWVRIVGTVIEDFCGAVEDDVMML